jgi:hypothetical protein
LAIYGSLIVIQRGLIYSEDYNCVEMSMDQYGVINKFVDCDVVTTENTEGSSEHVFLRTSIVDWEPTAIIPTPDFFYDHDKVYNDLIVFENKRGFAEYMRGKFDSWDNYEF